MNRRIAVHIRTSRVQLLPDAERNKNISSPKNKACTGLKGLDFKKINPEVGNLAVALNSNHCDVKNVIFCGVLFACFHRMIKIQTLTIGFVKWKIFRG